MNLILRKIILIISSFLYIIFLTTNIQASDIYTVKNIPVSSESINSTNAQKDAIAKGAEFALNELLRRLTPDYAHYSLPQLEQERISSAIQSIKILDEKITPSMYQAKVNFSFNPALIRNILIENGVPFNDNKSDPVIIIPILYNMGEILPITQDSPWIKAWNNTKNASNILNIKIPYEELSIMNINDLSQIIDEYSDLSNNFIINKLKDKYQPYKIYILEAKYNYNNSSDKYYVDIYQKDVYNLQEGRNVTSYRGQSGEELYYILQYASDKFTEKVTASWKTKSEQIATKKLKIKVTTPITSLTDWIKIKNDLYGMDFIDDIKIKTVSTNYITMDLHFKNTYQEFIGMLNDQYYNINKTQKGLILTRL